MIENERQFQVTMEQIAKLNQAQSKLDAVEGEDPIVIKLHRDSLNSVLARMKQEVAAYNRRTD